MALENVATCALKKNYSSGIAIFSEQEALLLRGTLHEALLRRHSRLLLMVVVTEWEFLMT